MNAMSRNCKVEKTMRVLQTLAALAILCLSTTSFSETVTQCTLEWDYSVDQEYRTDGFVFEKKNQDGFWSDSGTVAADVRKAACEEAGVTSKAATLRLRSYNASGRSEPSNEVTTDVIVEGPPPAPTSLRVNVQVNVTVE